MCSFPDQISNQANQLAQGKVLHQKLELVLSFVVSCDIHLQAARQMDLLMKELSVPLTRYVNGFPDPARLHPFEQALLQLTVGIPLYK